MIAVWMLYCVGIGMAFVVMGYALERGLHFAGRPTRWAWVVALLGSYAVPIAAWLRPDAFATFAAPIPITGESSATSSLPTAFRASSILHRPSSPSFTLSSLDVPLRWGWGVVSLAMLLTLGVAATRLVAMRRRWRHAAVDGRSVFVSPNVGPAVVGLWSPRVVLPEWALTLPDSDRELMLSHEEQHLRAQDPALLASALVPLLLAPWNPALWWQWRRLRLAVEMDCDARVLAEGRSAPAYGELLLEVGRRRATNLLGAAALGEPASFLESRIRRMLSGVPRWRWAGVTVALVVTAGAIIGACEAPRPVGPRNESQTQAATPTSAITGTLSAVIAPVDIDVPPTILSGASTSFPTLPRLAGIEGPVVLQASVDVNGRIDPGSVTVVESAHPAFTQVAKSALLSARFRPARAHGGVVSAVVRVTYDFVNAPSRAQVAREMTSQMTLRQAERLRPWVAENARRVFPTILEPTGPAMDAYLIHDSRLHVYRSSLVTMYYLNGERPKAEIGTRDLQQVLPSFSLNDGWAVIDPRALRGLVRDNVRVIWINHNPQPQNTPQAAPGGLDSAEVIRQAEQLRRLARQYHPEAFGRGTAPTAVALVMDARGNVLGHAARTRYARGADVRTVDGLVEDYLEVLTRLLPRFKDAQWSQSGYTNDPQPNVIIYWGIVLHS
jgi:TonB family protein